MYNKVMLMLMKSPDTDANMLEEKMAEEWERVKKLLPAGARHRRTLHLEDDPTQQIAHAAEATAAPPAFDATFEIGGPDIAWEELLPIIKEIPERFGGLVDIAKSAVVAGVEHLIIPGEDTLTIIFALRRLPGMTLEAFQDHWLNIHANFGRAVPNLMGYRQFHTGASANQDAASATGLGISDFDGVAQSFFKGVDDFLKIMSQPEVAKDAIEDEKNFIDHSRSSIGVYQVTGTGSV